METKEKEENKKIEFIQKNNGWMIAIITGVVITISKILEFIEYITASAYFSFYGLDINLYSYGDKSYIYSLVLSLIFMLASYSIIYCIKQLKNNYRNFKSQWKMILEDICIVLLSDIYVAFCLSSDLDNQSFVLNFIILFLGEIIAFFLTSNKIKKVNEVIDLKTEVINYFKRLPFLIIIFIVLISIRTQMNLNFNKDYRIIGDDKVIVYSNTDYYLVLNCEITDNSIILYKGSQTKISTLDIESKLVKFDKKEMK